jgi:hypothetical protein
LVNIKYCFIFNGVFEKQKSAQNEQKNAKNCVIQTPGVRVYRVRIKYNFGLREIYCSLTHQNFVHGWRNGLNRFRLIPVIRRNFAGKRDQG